MSGPNNIDLAGEEFWDNTWQHAGKMKFVDLKLHHHQKLDQLFEKWLTPGPNKSILEIGAANSFWLPYFSQKFNYEVYGLDYSEIGCQQARDNLKYWNVPGTILHRDLFDDNKDLINQFDVILSFGVVEHFTDPSTPLKQAYKFCKPGGIIITIIPNLIGFVGGTLQKLISKEIYDLHVPMSPPQLRDYHNIAGFEVEEADYFGFFNLGVVNLTKFPDIITRILYRLLRILNEIVWKTFKILQSMPDTRGFSPYILVVAKKPAKG